MSECQVRRLQPEDVNAIVTEVIRREITAMSAREAAFAPRTPAEADAAVARLESEIAALRAALRLRDPGPPSPPRRHRRQRSVSPSMRP